MKSNNCTLSLEVLVKRKKAKFFSLNTSIDVIVKFQLAMSRSSMDNMVSMCRTCVHPYRRENKVIRPKLHALALSKKSGTQTDEQTKTLKKLFELATKSPKITL